MSRKYIVYPGSGVPEARSVLKEDGLMLECHTEMPSSER